MRGDTTFGKSTHTLKRKQGKMRLMKNPMQGLERTGVLGVLSALRSGPWRGPLGVAVGVDRVGHRTDADHQADRRREKHWIVDGKRGGGEAQMPSRTTRTHRP